MKNLFKIELPGHKIYGSKDILFEWHEPPVIRNIVFRREIHRALRAIPILFPVFAGFGICAFAIKVWSKGHSLKEIPWWGLLAISAILATLLSLFSVAGVILKYFSSTLVRFASKGIGKWKSGWGLEFSCEYGQIRKVTLTRHNLAPEVQAFLVPLSTDQQAYLAISNAEIARAIEVLKQKGVLCERGDDAFVTSLKNEANPGEN